jgi:hypothetical protein
MAKNPNECLVELASELFGVLLMRLEQGQSALQQCFNSGFWASGMSVPLSAVLTVL